MTDGKRYKILLVDDEPLNIQFLEALMGDDFDVIFATNGEDALTIVGSGKPDIIVLDIMMPGMDGYEVCRRLKADPAARMIPVIFLTAKEGEEEEAKGLEMGAIDYINKPFNPEIVKRKITNHVQQITPRTAQHVRAAESDDRRRGRRASDSAPSRPWLIGAGLLVGLAALTAVGLQMGLIPWPAATSQAERTAPPAGTTPSSQPGAKLATPTDTLRSTAERAKETRRLSSLEWLDQSKCEKVPSVAWWRFVSHRSIARYVSRNLDGDWAGYIEKWAIRLKNVEDIQERNSTAVTGTGIKLSGDELADYVAKMKTRVAVIKCLRDEAEAFARTTGRQ